MLSSAFDITCRAWKSRFNVEYTHCGCPIPGDSIGKRLSRLIGLHGSQPPSHLVPFDRPDLLSATHPSDHNAVRFKQVSSVTHTLMNARYVNLKKQKDKEAMKAAKRAAKVEAEGRGLGLHPPHAYRDGEVVDSRGRRVYSDTYSPYMYGAPFLLPVPIYYGGGVGGCVSSCGTHVESGGAGGCGGGVSDVYHFSQTLSNIYSKFKCGSGGCSGGGCGGGSCGGGGKLFLSRKSGTC